MAMRNAPPRREGPAPLVYVHGAVRASSAPRLGRSPGMPGATGGPRVVAIGDRHWMVVSDVPAALYGEAPLRLQLADVEWRGRCAAVHLDALGRAMRSGPVVPLRLFTIFANETCALTYVRDALPTLSVLFDRLDGRVEYGVRLAWARAPSTGTAAGTSRRLPHEPANGREDTPRQRAVPPDRPVPPGDEAVRAPVVALVRGLAIDTRERPLPADGRVWLDLAVLVPAARGPAFVRAVRAFDREIRAGGHELALTGPWPPFTFATEQDEPA
jgi:hypothetical protein